MRDSSEINLFCILFIESSVSPSNLRTSFGVVLDALRRPHPSLKFTLNPSIKIFSPSMFEYVRTDFGVAVIKSAGSAASRYRGISRPWSNRLLAQPPRGPKSRNPAEPADDGSACGQRGRLGSPECLDFSLRGGCGSNRLDHGLENPSGRGGCASSRLDHGFPWAL